MSLVTVSCYSFCALVHMCWIPLYNVRCMIFFALSLLFLGLMLSVHCLYVESCLTSIHSCILSCWLVVADIFWMVVAAVLLSLSFTVWMYLSIFGTCSLAAHKIIDMPFSSIICCICLSCPSPNIACTLNTRLWYACITCSSVFFSSCLSLFQQWWSVCCMTWS